MESKAQPMDMKEWKCVAENILFSDLPDMDDVLCVLDQVLLGKNRPFRLACGAGGLDEEGGIMGIPLCGDPLMRIHWK